MEIAITPKPEWTEKVWGRTRCVMCGTNFEVHELKINRGGYCSRHHHRKWNQFHVCSGELKVEIFGEDDLGNCDDTPAADRILNEGDQFTVGPEEWHRFVALADCHVFEIYWTVDIDPDDINREDEGGIDPTISALGILT